MRVGLGYDVHRLVPERQCILGGVNIPYPLGLQGHSDADVLAHAVADALLGAARLGDIGIHFPDTDPSIKGISSMAILSRVREMLHPTGLIIANIDCVVVAEEPKIGSYAALMAETMARSLGISQDKISIKGKTTEGLGFTGSRQGIAAYAVVLLVSGEPTPRQESEDLGDQDI